MKHVVYHCYGGNHSSVVAAALHTGFLPNNRKPSFQELFSCPYFDSFTKYNIGEFHLMGEDNNKNKVYTLGCMKAGKLVEKIIVELSEVLSITLQEIVMVNMMPLVNIPLKLGGYLSRSQGLIFPGRWMAAWGILLCYYDITDVVENTKQILE